MEFSEELIEKIWDKAARVNGHNPKVHRRDQYGCWIERSAYSNQKNMFGWVIGYIKPLSQGGNNELSNLCPLQWKNAEKYFPNQITI